MFNLDDKIITRTINNIWIFIFIVFSYVVQSQTISGTIKDSISNEVLPYVNMTLLSKNIGTTTNEKGEYFFNSRGNTNDSLLVSYMGYATKKFSLQDFENTANNNLDIQLVESKQQIDEVVLKVKKAKYTTSRKLGIDRQMFKYAPAVQFGMERIVLIENIKKRKGRVNEVVFFLRENPQTSFRAYPTFYRVVFYAYDSKNDAPGKLLSYYPLLIKPEENKKQRICINVKEYNILFPKSGLCIGIETINPEPKRKINKIHTTYPNLLLTYDQKPLMWLNYRGRKLGKWEWIHNSKTPFSKQKTSYMNPLLHLKIQYRK